MKTKTATVMVIGGGHPQLSLIEAIHDLNLSVWIVDDRKNLPSASLADRVIPIYRYDRDRILEAAREAQPDFVASGGSDKAVWIMALIAELLDILAYVPSSVAELPITKGVLREMLLEQGVAVPRTVVMSSMDELKSVEWDLLSFPVVVKPDGGIGQTALNIANSITEAIESGKEAFLSSEHDRVLVQEFVDGPEIGVNGIVINGTFHLLTTSFRRSLRGRGLAFGVAMEKVFPAITDAGHLDSLSNAMQRACAVMGVVNCPIYAQVISSEKGFFLIEIMPRLGGGEDPRLVQVATGFNLSKATALLSMGESVDFQSLFEDPSVHAAVLRFINVPPGKVSSITGIEDAARCPGVRKVTPFLSIGDKVKELSSSRERGGYILAVGESCDQASDNAKSAEERIRIDAC